MMRTGICRTALALGALGALGCQTTFDRWYLASARIEQRSDYGNNDEVERATSAAGELLKQGRALVVFMPPDSCDSDALRDIGDGEERSLMKMQCSGLVTTLERFAKHEGYDVLDWNHLRTKTQREATVAAREEKVDVLFVIDDFSINRRTADKSKIGNIEFAAQDSSGRHPVNVGEDVGARCEKLIAPRGAGGRGPAVSATLAIKMVAVGDGRVKWYYRKTFGTQDQRSEQTRELWYHAPGHKENTGVGWIVLGAVGLAAGGGAMIAGGILRGDEAPDDTKHPGIALLAGGGVAAALGVASLIIGGVQASSDPIYPSPSALICNGPGSRGPGEPDPEPAAEPESPHEGSSYSFHQEEKNVGDVERKRQEELTRGSIQDFMNELKKVRNAGPRGS